MKTRPVLNCLAAAGLATLVPVAPLRAQQAPTYVPPPQYQTPPGSPQPASRPPHPPPPSSYYVSPMEFLPTFGRKFGDMFRRVFYGDAPPRGYPAQGGPPPPGAGRSLDQPPSGYPPRGAQPPPPAYQPPPRYEAPPRQEAAPRYEVPPQARSSPPTPSRSESQPAARPPTRSQPPAVTAPTKSKTDVPPPSTAATKPSVSKPAPKPAADSPPRQETKPASKQMVDAPPPPEKKSDAAPSGGAFLKGKRTNKPGRVVSPYPPYQELDVTGLSSGSLALDPTTQKVFEVP